MERKVSNSHFEKAKTLFPGGVNSPVRAFQSVGGSPLFIDRGAGSRIWDVDGNEFIDYCCSWGPLVLGHAPKHVENAIIEAVKKGTSFGAPTVLENKLAEIILEHHRYIEKIRFVNSGTEATMSAIRLARGYSGKNKIIKFEGCYHGHVDALLVQAGSGLVTLGTSSSAGVPEAYVQETIVLPLHDLEALNTAAERFKNDIACVIIEPIPANNGLLIQDASFLHALREFCTQQGILLIFDEVISGFRVGFEGAAGLYGIQPDLLCFGKIIGGGLPVGAYAGSAEIMNHIAPLGPVYQAGTLSGNPVAMAAGAAQLELCLEKGFYEQLEAKTKRLTGSIEAYAAQKGYVFKMHSVGSVFWLAFSDVVRIRKSSEIDPESMRYFSKLHAALLERGVYIGPSGYEVGFVSAAHSDADIDRTIEVFCECLDLVF